jgi:hypothetical protein
MQQPARLAARRLMNDLMVRAVCASSGLTEADIRSWSESRCRSSMPVHWRMTSSPGTSILLAQVAVLLSLRPYCSRPSLLILFAAVRGDAICWGRFSYRAQVHAQLSDVWLLPHVVLLPLGSGTSVLFLLCIDAAVVSVSALHRGAFALTAYSAGRIPRLLFTLPCLIHMVCKSLVCV